MILWIDARERYPEKGHIGRAMVAVVVLGVFQLTVTFPFAHGFPGWLTTAAHASALLWIVAMVVMLRMVVLVEVECARCRLHQVTNGAEIEQILPASVWALTKNQFRRKRHRDPLVSAPTANIVLRRAWDMQPARPSSRSYASVNPVPRLSDHDAWESIGAQIDPFYINAAIREINADRTRGQQAVVTTATVAGLG